jgi:hypothetical protein
MASKPLSDLYRLVSKRDVKDMIDLARHLSSEYPPLKVDEMSPPLHSGAKVDKIAQSLVPSHYVQDNVTTADGNCLFTAASLALCGCEKLSAELRVCTAIELATNTEYYKNHPVVMKCGLKTEGGKLCEISSIYYTTILSAHSSKVIEKSGFHAAISQEIITTTQNGSYSGLL